MMLAQGANLILVQSTNEKNVEEIKALSQKFGVPIISYDRFFSHDGFYPM